MHAAQTKQSNSRIVRWSDGTFSLQLGSELFDITLKIDQSAVSAGATNPVPPAAPAAGGLSASTTDKGRGHSLSFITAQHAYTELIEAQASVYGSMSFRPTTLQSSSHRRLAGSIAARNVKGRSVRRLDIPQVDPEKLKAEREKAEVDKAKKARRQNRQPGSRRKGARRQTRMIGYSDEEGSQEGDNDDGAFGGSSRPRPGAYDDSADENDDFVVDDDAAESGADQDLDAMDEVERAEARIERNARRGNDMADDGSSAAPAPRRRLVVDDSDEE